MSAPPLFYAPSSLGGLTLAWDGNERRLENAAVEILLAIDQPDRLELVSGAADLPLPETPLSLDWRSGGRAERLFEGLAFRWTRSESVHAPWTHRVSARAAYSLAGGRPAPAFYFQQAPSGIAEQLALELGLIPVVGREPFSRGAPSRSNGSLQGAARVERREDPVPFLKMLARESGRALAITGNRLYFMEDFAGVGELREISPAAGVSSIELERRPGGVRWLRLSLPSFRLVRPLDGIRITGFDRMLGAGGNGGADFRAVRCRFRRESGIGEPGAWRTDLWLVGEGAGPRAFQIDDWPLEDGGGLAS